MRNHWAEIEKYLEDQKIAQELIGELRDFHMRYEVEDQVKERVEKPDILFYGKKILEMSIAALLQGEKLSLEGIEVTAKYGDGSEKIVTDFTVSGFEPIAGEHTVIVSYMEKTASFKVRVAEKV